MSFDAISRRRLMTTFAGFAAAAALDPFPTIVPVFAEDATPAPDLPEAADSQVLRWIDVGTTKLSQWTYDALWTRMSQNVYMTPFIQLRDGSITPGICSSYTISDDLLTYVFTMNPDAVWSDGSRITAGDIKYSWDYMANPAKSQNIFNYYQTQNVVGNDAVYNGTADGMSGLVVVDDDTLQITLKQPYTPFIYYCTHNLMGVHQQANIVDGGDDWDKKPTIASGPFMVDTFDINSGSVTFVQNPKWWGTKPKLERIEFSAVTDYNSQLLVWSNDGCEVWSNGATLDFLQQYGLDEVQDQPAPSSRFFLLNTQQPPFDDEHFRRAIQ